jgi:hypothetical protein
MSKDCSGLFDIKEDSMRHEQEELGEYTGGGDRSVPS